MLKSRTLKIVVLVCLVVILVGAGSAFAASVTITPPATGSISAGVGEATVEGFTVTNYEFTLNATDPTKVDSVTITLNSAATEVHVEFVKSSGYFYNCGGSGTTWECDTTVSGHELLTQSIDTINVVAVNNRP